MNYQNHLGIVALSLVGWPTSEPPRVSPTAEAATDRIACGGEQRGGKTPSEPTDTWMTAAGEGRRERTRESASPLGWGAPQCQGELPEAKRSRWR